MRCPSCGTENEPDSRFCGGCGARLAGESRLAPTQKIDTGAQPIQTAGQQSVQPPAQVVSQRTPSQSPAPRNASGQQNVPPASYPLTPSVQRPPSTSRPQTAAQARPPTNGAAPAAAQSLQPTSQQRRPKIDPSTSMAPPPKRRLGLILAVLLVDLALAGAGAYMLAEGLSSSGASPSSPSSGSSGSSPPPAAKPAAGSGPSAANTGSSAATTGPSTAGASSAIANTTPPDAAVLVTPIDAPVAIATTPPDAAAKPKANAQGRKKKQTGKQSTQPVDPYDEGPSDPFPPDLPPPPPPPQ